MLTPHVFAGVRGVACLLSRWGRPPGPAGCLQEGRVQDPLSPRPHALLLLPNLHFPRLKSLLSMGTGHFIWNNGLLMWNWGFLPQKLTFLNASKTALSLPIRRLGTNALCNPSRTWVCRESWPLEAGADVQRSRRSQWLPSVLWICELHKIKWMAVVPGGTCWQKRGIFKRSSQTFSICLALNLVSE